MKKNICLLGCVMLGALVACSTGSESASRPPDPALVAAADAAVVTPNEPVPERLQRRFANELRILNENNMTRETITNGNGSLGYCQGVYNEDQPGRPAILVFQIGRAHV